jgi:hypothetical protein
MVAEIRGQHETDWAAMRAVSELLGVGTTETVRKWVRQAEIDAGSRPGVSSEESAELKRLKRENAELKRAFGFAAGEQFSPRRPTRPGVGCEVRSGPLRGVRGGAAVSGAGDAGVDVYDRVGPPTSAHAMADAELAERIEKIWADSGRSYGAPRVHARLHRDGIRVGRKRVERIMAQNGWQGAYLRRGWKITTVPGVPATPAPDLVDRDFTATRPNQLWVADVTYVRTMVGFFYLAMVLDVFSRRLIGWMMADTLRTELVLAALEMAVHHRDTGPFAV